MATTQGLTTTQRGLGYTHQQRRKQLLPAAIGQPCPIQGPRCDRIMIDPKRMELDHSIPRALGGTQGDRIVCMPCNRGLGAMLANKIRRRKRLQRQAMWTRW